MKRRPKSFPASSTFNEFLTQLKEEDQVSSTSKNSNSDNSPSAVNPSTLNSAEKVEEVISNTTQSSLADIETSNETKVNPQAIKVDTETKDTVETQDNSSSSSINQKVKAVFEAESDNPVSIDQKGLIKTLTPTLAELTNFLMSLPTAQITRRGYNREELQVRLPADISLALRNLSAYLSLMHSGSNFHVDDLVNHLVRQFVLTYLESIQQMGKQLAKAETTRQLQINESLRSIEIK